MTTEQKNIKTDSRPEIGKISLYDRLHFRMISIVHETLYGLFVDPYPPLRAAGVVRGASVLEVGCGPGFFTTPAAEIVGATGSVYALDINPAAVRHVRHKIEKSGLENVQVLLADAGKTGLPDESVDVAFLFGVVHALKDLDAVVEEIHRVLKSQGLLSVQSSRLSEEKLVETMTRKRLFRPLGNEGRIYRFSKAVLPSGGGDPWK